MREPFGLVPIGVVHSPLLAPEAAPRQGREAGVEAEVEVFPEYAEALAGIEGRGRVWVVCLLHLARRDLLQVASRGGDGPRRGVFACRTPTRPNPLAAYPVELLAVRGTRLRNHRTRSIRTGSAPVECSNTGTRAR